MSQDREKRDRVRKSVESHVANILEGLPVPLHMLAVGYIPESNCDLGTCNSSRNAQCVQCISMSYLLYFDGLC